jgi:hypothetical protein
MIINYSRVNRRKSVFSNNRNASVIVSKFTRPALNRLLSYSYHLNQCPLNYYTQCACSTKFHSALRATSNFRSCYFPHGTPVGTQKNVTPARVAESNVFCRKTYYDYYAFLGACVLNCTECKFTSYIFSRTVERSERLGPIMQRNQVRAFRPTSTRPETDG